MAKKQKPVEQFTGLTLEQWQRDTDNIVWAQREPRFKWIVSVLLNEARVAHELATGCSEARAFGRVEGYHQAIEVLRSLGRRASRPPPDIEETYENPERALRELEPTE